MKENSPVFEKKFYVVGVSFKRTDTHERSKFSITPEQGLKAYHQTSDCLDHYLILSTCNRTEIYGFAPCEYVLSAFLLHISGATRQEVSENSYVREGDEAVKHLLMVAAGLDSQIPGDYEIIAQIRNAFNASKQSGRSNGFIERVVSQANQVSKAIKNTTAFSDGTVSVSYSVARQIGELMKKHALNRICIVGLGKIGLNTLKYLRQHAPGAEITVVNRNEQKLSEIAAAYDLASFRFDELTRAVSENEIVVVATSVDTPILYANDLNGSKVQFVFDLSMPHNVAVDVYESRSVTVFDVDQVSVTVNATLDRRMAEVPKVKAIVEAKAQELFDWQERRKQRTTGARENHKSFLIPENVVADTAHSLPRKRSCFMANQCCDGKSTVVWLPSTTCSA